MIAGVLILVLGVVFGSCFGVSLRRGIYRRRRRK